MFLLCALCAVIGLATFPSSSQAEVSGNLVIVGNGPEQTTIESIARAFEKANPRAYVDVVWDDHSKPVEMVKTGEAHIAVTGSEDPALAATQVAWDGIGILVHLSNFTKEVTKQQVADIYSGKVKEWSELGGPETKILLIDRPKNQNIREAFERQLGIDGKIPDSAKMIAKDDKVIKTVVGTLPPMTVQDTLPLWENGFATRIGEIGHPTLIVWGEEDRVFPLPVGEELNRTIKGSTLVRIPSAGHIPMWERPDLTNRAIMEFLQR